MWTNKPKPSVDQFIAALELVEAGTLTFVEGDTLHFVLTYCHDRHWKPACFFWMLKGNAQQEHLTEAKAVMRSFIAELRVEFGGGSQKVLRILHSLMLDIEDLRFSPCDEPVKLYQMQDFARSLRLPEMSSIKEILLALSTAEAFELLQSRSANDYWRLNIFLHATSQQRHYFRGFPVQKSHIHMGIWEVRSKMKVPGKWLLKQPTFLETVSSGAYLMQGQTLVPNPILLDEEERHYCSMSIGGLACAYRFDGPDPDNPPPGPYQTLAEVHAFGHAWEGYADTIGGGYQVYDMNTHGQVGNTLIRS